MESRRPETYLDGAVLFIDKPLTWTSFDVVNKIRKSLRHYLGIQKIKVGHAGTLDPLATGLVIICTGKATKQIMQYQDLDKAYDAQVRLGSTTLSLGAHHPGNGSHVSETVHWRAATTSTTIFSQKCGWETGL